MLFLCVWWYLQFPGVTDFMFTMKEIKDLLGGKSAAGKELYVEAVVYSWFWVQEASGSGLCVVYGDEVELVLLGDPSRTFKPGMPVSIYVSIDYAYFFWKHMSYFTF